MQRRTLATTGLALAAAAMLGLPGQAAAQETIKIGLIAPMSGNYARPGQVTKMGAERGIEDINAQGGIAALGGAQLELLVIDTGDTTEKAKNAAQRTVAAHPGLGAATG